MILAQGGFLFLPKEAHAESSYVSGMERYDASGWSASKIIYNVSQWYGINLFCETLFRIVTAPAIWDAVSHRPVKTVLV
jgi:hypothetical protein